MDICEAYPKFEQRHFYWIDPFTFKASDEHHTLRGKVRRKEFETLDDFYQALKPFLKPRKLGKALKDAKKRTSQACDVRFLASLSALPNLRGFRNGFNA